MKKILVDKKFIPLDKSWIIRMGMLDMLNGKDDILDFLHGQEELSDDLQALGRAVADWQTEKKIDVGESGTLYRFLKFASWKLGLGKEFILQGALGTRDINDDPKIVDYPLEKLLKLDNGTSQWASIAVMMGNNEQIENPPYKLKATYEAVAHWKNQREKGQCWEPRHDETICKQAETFARIIKGEKPDFVPEQPEDYCFARAFGFVTKEEGLKRWPSLVGHESNRIEEMEKSLAAAEEGKSITSKDHRVVQSISMLQKAHRKEIKVACPEAVKKSWPQFWKFLEAIQ